MDQPAVSGSRDKSTTRLATSGTLDSLDETQFIESSLVLRPAGDAMRDHEDSLPIVVQLLIWILNKLLPRFDQIRQLYLDADQLSVARVDRKIVVCHHVQGAIKCEIPCNPLSAWPAYYSYEKYHHIARHPKPIDDYGQHVDCSLQFCLLEYNFTEHLTVRGQFADRKFHPIILVLPLPSGLVI